MKILDVINIKELRNFSKIKCNVVLKTSWNHSEFAGVIVHGEYFGDSSAKLVTVDQMKALCNGNTAIEFVNYKNDKNVILKYVSNSVGFAINMNSDTPTEVISSEIKEIHPISLSPILKIDEEYSKGFRISADNKVVSSEYHTDYELLIGLDAIIQSLHPSEYLRKISGTRERAIETIATYKYNESVAESMKLFGK